MSRSGPSKADPVFTPRRSSRRSSLNSPGRVGRRSSLLQQYKDGNMDSFASTPGRSILSDNTDIEQPRRQSWWKKLDDNNTREIIEALGNEKVDEAHNVLEDLDVEILSQEKEQEGRRYFSLDLPDSSGSETIDSIIIPNRRLFTQKENIPQKKFSNLFGPKESMVKLYKPNTEKINDITSMVGPKKLFSQAPTDRHKIFETVTTSPIKTSQEGFIASPKKLFNQENPQLKTIFTDFINLSPKKSGDILEPEARSKNLFPQNAKERKSIFPSALLETSADKTANKTTEIRKEVQGQVRTLFGNRPTTKRKNMFADFIVVESEDEVPEIQPRMFGFSKKPEAKRRGSSSSHALTDAEDDWKMLPSSTMMEHMEGLSSPVKRPKLSTIPRERESEGTREADVLTDDEIVPTNKQTQNKTYNKNKSLSHLSVHKNATIAALEEVNKSLPIEFVNNDSEAENVIQQIANITKHTEKLIQNKTQTIDKTFNKTQIQETPVEKVDNELKDNTRKEISENLINNQEIDKSNKEITIKSDTRKSKTFIINNRDTSKAKGEDSIATAQDEPNISDESEPEEVMKLTYDEDEIEENEQADQINIPLEVIAEASNERDPESMEISNNKSKRTGEDSQDKNTTPEANDIPFVENIEENKKQDKENTADIVFDEMIADITDPNVEKLKEHKNVQHSRELIIDQVMEIDIVQPDTNERNQEIENQEEVNVVSQKTGEEIEENVQVHEEIATEPEELNEVQSNHSQNASVENNEDEPSIHEVSEDENVDQDESEEQSNHEDAESVEPEELEPSQVEESDHNESENENNEQNESDNESPVAEIEENKETTDNEEIPESPNVTHDTTGRNRNKKQINLKSPEAILLNKTTQNDSYQLKERRTSLRKTKSLMHSPKIDRVSLDSNKNSSAEGSGWDSHRTTRKTLRQTFGKDFTPRKSLRALVMEKSAKRQTEQRVSVGYPQANSTEIVQNFTVPQEMPVVNDTVDITADNDHITSDDNHDTRDKGDDTQNDTPDVTADNNDTPDDTTDNNDDTADNNDDIPDNNDDTPGNNEVTADNNYESVDNNHDTAEVEYSELENSALKTPDVSVRTRQTTLERYLENIRRDIEDRKRNSEVAVKKLLTAPKRDMPDFYRASMKPLPRSRTGTKPRVSKSKPSAIPLDRIPEEILEDMKYKPPKRFRKNDASWITKRLYKYLETKLEPKYDFKARVKAEKLVAHIYLFTKSIQKLEQAPLDDIKELKIIMARLDIVSTHHDFYEFFYEFMPREVRIKVVPNMTNKLPMPKHGIFNEIIRAER